MLSGLRPFISILLNGTLHNAAQYLKKLFNFKKTKVHFVIILDITCNAYLIGTLIQAEKIVATIANSKTLV